MYSHGPVSLLPSSLRKPKVRRDPYFSNVALLLHCNGSDASTTFTDNSSGGKTVTANGNAQIDTAQSKFGGASGLFDGTGDYLSAADSADWYFATGDFTIETFIRFNSVSGNQSIYSQFVDLDNRIQVRFLGATTALSLFVRTGAVTTISAGATWAPSTGTWYHVALTRSGTTFRFFADGALLGGGTDADEIPNLATGIQIGASNAGETFNGWLDEYRVTKGVARYTAAFTPPALAFPSL